MTLFIAFLISLVVSFSPQQPIDHSDKPCVATEVMTEGVRSDCHGWQPAKGEKMFAPTEVNSSEFQAIILPREKAEQEFKQLCADGTNDQRLKALAAALNPMPDWPQFVMNNEPSVCNRNPKPVVPVPIEKQSSPFPRGDKWDETPERSRCYFA